MTSGNGSEPPRGNAPAPDAPLDELLKWSGHAPAKPEPSAPARRADDVLSGRVVQPQREERGKEPSPRRGFPPAWQIAIGALAVWAIVQFIASMLFMLGFLALAVAVVAGAYAIGRARGGGKR